MAYDFDDLSKDLSVEEFARFRDYIQRHSGIYLEQTKLDSLRISLVTRATRHEFKDLEEYFRLLVDDDDEFRELLNLITINETSFFRFPQQFDALRNAVIPELIADRPDSNRTFRVWSAGCSTGEEPYTIAMTLLDSGLESMGWRCHVMGTDVSTKALGVARAGIYKGKALQNVSEDVLSRHFRRIPEGFQVSGNVRRLVDFGYHNLIKEPYPLSLMGDWDIIFCRNVTIYFKVESTRRVVKNLFNSLNDGGYLFVGHSETLTSISEDFEAVEIGGVFLYRKSRSGRRTQVAADVQKPQYTLASATASAEQTSPETVGEQGRSEERALRRLWSGELPGGAAQGLQPAASDEEGAETVEPRSAAAPQDAEAPEEHEEPDLAELLEEARVSVQAGQHAEARASLESVLEFDRNNFDAHLLLAFSYADAGDYELALKECDRALAINPLLPGARYVLGIIYQRQGDLVRAVSELKKTIYIDADFVLAQLNLGNIYRSQGNFDAACRAYQNAAESLERSPGGPWTEFMGGFDADLLARTCERSLIECRKAMGIA
jgi:chemotaxis protein methyltransferase CheR